MDSHTNACFLLDFYGQLLTERTRETLELHFAEDMSLSEIADTGGVSRQAVHDRIRRGMEVLDGYETRLGLVARFLRQKSLAKDALDALDNQDPDRVRALLGQLTESL